MPAIVVRRLLLIGCLIILIAYAVSLLSVRWHDDDLTEAALVRSGGATAVIPYYWYQWSGRVGYALVVGVEKALPEAWAGVPLIGILMLWAWSCWELGRERGLVVLIATLAAAPQLDESLYWQSGATVYALPLALFTFALVCVKRHWQTVIPAFLTLFIATLSDTMQVAQVVALGGLFALFPAYRRPFAVMLVVAVAGLVIVQLAPGNAYRRAYFPIPDIWLSFRYGLQTMGVTFAEAVRHTPLAILIVIAVGAWRGNSIVSYHDKRQALWILITVMMLNFACQWAAYYATSRALFMRAQIVPLFGTLAGLCAVSKLLISPAMHATRNAYANR